MPCIYSKQYYIIPDSFDVMNKLLIYTVRQKISCRRHCLLFPCMNDIECVSLLITLTQSDDTAKLQWIRQTNNSVYVEFKLIIIIIIHILDKNERCQGCQNP